MSQRAVVAPPVHRNGTRPHTLPEPAEPDPGQPAPELPWWLTLLRGSRLPRGVRGLASDVAALLLAALDVWLVIPEDAPTYSIWLSGMAIAAMVMRRHVPFLAVLVTVPGFLVGWSQLAAMIALGTLAKRRGLTWPTIVGAVLVWVCRYIQWPLDEAFFPQSWQEHVLNGIYGVIVVVMPLAIGLLVTVSQELARRIAELAASREREKRLLAETIRSTERARLAREMHDVVSHQVTLIAMQAGALQVASAANSAAKETADAAGTIRELSIRTLDELRELVGVLRSGGADDDSPGVEKVRDLVTQFRHGCANGTGGIPITLEVDLAPERLPTPVSQAAYRTVQEALTNVRKHAAGAHTTVRALAREDNLLVEVRNERPAARSQPADLPSGGHGLLGLRERAGLLGGSLHAGSTDDGGFVVEATYPLAR